MQRPCRQGLVLQGTPCWLRLKVGPHQAVSSSKAGALVPSWPTHTVGAGAMPAECRAVARLVSPIDQLQADSCWHPAAQVQAMAGLPAQQLCTA